MGFIKRFWEDNKEAIVQIGLLLEAAALALTCGGGCA